jgi:hypothetical protein
MITQEKPLKPAAAKTALASRVRTKRSQTGAQFHGSIPKPAKLGISAQKVQSGASAAGQAAEGFRTGRRRRDSDANSPVAELAHFWDT